MAARNPNELTITRLYDHSVKLVWDAWSDPKKVDKWWGPRGFTITTHSKDLRIGGHWAYTMHGPDGTKWENKTIYYEVEEYSKLVYDHGGNDDRPPLFRVTVTFEEVKGKTKMEMTMAFESPEKALEVQGFIKQAGGNTTWDRLAEYLGEKEGKNKFVINRSFEAPIASVYKLWTHPDHLSKWLPPTGMKMEYQTPNIEAGGSITYKMTDEKNVTMYLRINYIALNPVTGLEYTQQFLDHKGNISRHPMARVWPNTIHSMVTLSEEGPNQTRVTVEWVPYGKVTEGEMLMFTKAKPDLTRGWTDSFDKLDKAL